MNDLRVLLDTHAWVWLTMYPNTLSQSAGHAIRSADSVLVASISLWEVGMLVSKKRIRLDLPVREWMTRSLVACELVHIDPEIAAISGELKIHGDPADRLILATAIHTGACLLTRDETLLGLASSHGVPVLEA